MKNPALLLKRIVISGMTLCLVVLGGAQIHAVTSKVETLQESKKSAEDLALANGFAAHKALYEVSLIESKSGTRLVNVSGEMLYEWQPSCGGWVSNHRFNLTYDYADSPPVQIMSDFSNFENFDGNHLSFITQRKKEGRVYEEILGHAEKQISAETGKKQGNAIYKSPKGLTYDLPEATLFPVSHTLEILKSLQQGKKFFSATVFDGSDEDGPVEINAFIGKERKIEKALMNTEGKDIDTSLLTATAHNVRLAFFPLSEGSEESEYEMSLLFQKNGIITDMVIEYDDFSVKQKLIALEPLSGQCEE